jgi:hypothetical protein
MSNGFPERIYPLVRVHLALRVPGMRDADSLDRGRANVTRRRLAIAAALSLLLSVATGWAWYSTARFTFEDPTMPSPDLYVIESRPWLGWLSVALIVSGIVLLVVRDFFPNRPGRAQQAGTANQEECFAHD